jgi:redox-sensing transcriptional repressor
LREILGLGERYPLALLGAGKIGSALVQHSGFRDRGFDIVAIFDRDPDKIGQEWDGLRIDDIARLEEVLRERPVKMAVITTPAEVAQEVADRLGVLGVKAILNFAPVQLSVPEDVTVKTVNLALELESLSYALTGHWARLE